MILSPEERRVLRDVATAAGGRLISSYLPANGTGRPCVAMVVQGLRDVWNAAELLTERAPLLARALRGPSIERDGPFHVLFWPGVTCE